MINNLIKLANNYGYVVEFSNSHSFICFDTKSIRVQRGSEVVTNLTHEIVHLLQQERGVLRRVPALYREESECVRHMCELAYTSAELEAEVVAFTMQNYPEVVLALG